MSVFDLAMTTTFHALQLARGVVASIKVSSATTLVDVTIVPAETQRDELNDDNQVISRRLQDWLILVSDLDGNEPKESWEITVNSEVFKLVKIDTDKAYRYHNATTNTVYRVHTILKTGGNG